MIEDFLGQSSWVKWNPRRGGGFNRLNTFYYYA